MPLKFKRHFYLQILSYHQYQYMSTIADANLKLTSKEWGVLVLLAAINFTHTMDFVMVIPMGPKLIQKLHITPAEVGHIISAYTISAAIFGLIGAGIIDRIDRKKMLIISFFGFPHPYIVTPLLKLFFIKINDKISTLSSSIHNRIEET